MSRLRRDASRSNISHSSALHAHARRLPQPPLLAFNMSENPYALCPARCLEASVGKWPYPEFFVGYTWPDPVALRARRLPSLDCGGRRFGVGEFDASGQCNPSPCSSPDVANPNSGARETLIGSVRFPGKLEGKHRRSRAEALVLIGNPSKKASLALERDETGFGADIRYQSATKKTAMISPDGKPEEHSELDRFIRT